MHCLPCELWNHILSFLPISDLIEAKNVCLQWEAIIAGFVEQGRVKTDHFVLTRPFEMPVDVPDLIPLSDPNAAAQHLLPLESRLGMDYFSITPSRPCLLLGMGFHGPYTGHAPHHSKAVRDLTTTLEAFSPSGALLAHRVKHCRVKPPRVLLPVFFDRPPYLTPSEPVTLAASFESPVMTSDSEDNACCHRPVAYDAKSMLGGFTFVEPLTEGKRCHVAYVKCGHVRKIYYWPLN